MHMSTAPAAAALSALCLASLKLMAPRNSLNELVLNVVAVCSACVRRAGVRSRCGGPDTLRRCAALAKTEPAVPLCHDMAAARRAAAGAGVAAHAHRVALCAAQTQPTRLPLCPQHGVCCQRPSGLRSLPHHLPSLGSAANPPLLR